MFSLVFFCPSDFCLDHVAPFFLVCSAPRKCLFRFNPLTSDGCQSYNVLVSVLERILSLTDSLRGRPFPAGAGNNACFFDLLLWGVSKGEYQFRPCCL
ncbi:hypothetical protein DPMN_062700 [Dreissena polymorpha]|uniref:Uncharacterized protein n=1 Tax=Dreissena polymorpha TaxID=45954 RepID=A0A9D4CAB5_DREPO|nr:hypothetical protein DPMN_062700 [Dreissena polymorpha]